MREKVPQSRICPAPRVLRQCTSLLYKTLGFFIKILFSELMQIGAKNRTKMMQIVPKITEMVQISTGNYPKLS